MWNDWQTDSYEGQTSELVKIKGYQDDEINAYVARPNGTGPYPGVVLLHHMPGWDEFCRETARRFADHGYIVICPNLYERFGHGTPVDVAAKARGEGGVSDESVVADAKASLDWICARLRLGDGGGIQPRQPTTNQRSCPSRRCLG